jgi:hypothetical protein
MFVAFSLLAAAGPAAAQSADRAPAPAAVPTPAPTAPSAAQPPERPAGSRLILRLDEVEGPRMNFGSSASEKYPAKDLPSLGGDARQVEGGLRSSPYPKSSDNLP